MKHVIGNTMHVVNRMEIWKYFQYPGLSDCCLPPTQQFFLLYHGENKLIFNEVLDQHVLLDLYSASSLKP
jgi:hypothetical protein